MKHHLKKSTYLPLILLIVLTLAALVAQVSSLAAESMNVYLPLVLKNHSLTITGQITAPDGTPLTHVQIALNGNIINAASNAPQTVNTVIFTDADGNYILTGLMPGEYTLTPLKDGYTFSPATRQLNLPPESVGQNFLAKVKDGDLIENGTCEGDNGWTFPATPYSATYSQEQEHAGNRSIRTGIALASDNRLSHSSVNQVISVPGNAPQYILSLWVYTLSGEVNTGNLPNLPTDTFDPNVALGDDIQYILVLDPETDQVLEPLYWERKNNKEWQRIEFDMRKYAGMKIKLNIGTYNNGYSGVTAMYVDDVSFNIGPIDTGPTPTPGGVITPSPTPICENILGNPGFEAEDLWEIPLTAYSASYTQERVKSGNQAMRTGIGSGANVYSYSDVRQRISIPKSSGATILTMWLYARSTSTTNEQEQSESALSFPAQPLSTDIQNVALSGDLQYVILLDTNLTWIDTLVWQRSNSSEWQYYQFDLRKYAGEGLYIQIGSYNDGWGTLTALYADEMSLGTCQGPTATPTATPDPAITPTASPVPTLTPTPSITPTPLPASCSNEVEDTSFEEENTWEILNTAYAADYSQEEAYYGRQSMRIGIVNASHNRLSYSDVRQTISIPNTPHVDLYFWQYPISGEPANKPFDAISPTEHWGEQALSGDIQYVIAIDANGNQLLIYQNRTNEASWVLRHLDLKNFAGQTITLQFGVYNDGGGGVTSMYVDNVVMLVCP